MNHSMWIRCPVVDMNHIVIFDVIQIDVIHIKVRFWRHKLIWIIHIIPYFECRCDSHHHFSMWIHLLLRCVFLCKSTPPYVLFRVLFSILCDSVISPFVVTCHWLVWILYSSLADLFTFIGSLKEGEKYQIIVFDYRSNINGASLLDASSAPFGCQAV